MNVCEWVKRKKNITVKCFDCGGWGECVHVCVDAHALCALIGHQVKTKC